MINILKPIIDQKNLNKRYLRYMVLRVFIVTVMLGLSTSIQFKSESLPEVSLSLIFFILITHYILSFAFYCLFIKNQEITINIYLQIITDTLLISLLVYVTGGVGSIYPILYHMVIIYAALFLSPRGSFIAASISSLFYGFMTLGEYFQWIHPIFSESLEYQISMGSVFSKSVTYIGSFYVVALLVNVIVEQEKVTRLLLAKKSSDFDKLDSLHRSIVESIDLGIVTIDLDTNIKSINRTGEQMMGKKFDDIHNKNLKSIFPIFYNAFTQRKKGYLQKFETESTLTTDQNETIIHLSISSLLDWKNNKIGEIFIFRDITAVKEIEKQAEESKRLALIGEMAAGLAHEVRNPLASLSGSIQLLRNNLELNETNERLMQIILRGRNQLENLVKDFLLLSRQGPEKKEEIFLPVLIEEIIESIKYGPDWNDQIKVTHHWNGRRVIYGNKLEIKEVIWNLIMNAIQSMPNGGIINTKIQTIHVKSIPYVALQITDTGIGIETDNLHKIFTPFYTSKERGTGLGLAIVNRITESHAGKLSVKSTKGKGTCFTVLFPDETLE